MRTIIDAHNYIKRVYHGGGNPYNLALELFQKPGEKILVCDGPRSRDYRRSIYEKYKQGRNTGDDPVYWEVYNNIKELFLMFPETTLVEMETGEADDWIADNVRSTDIVISNDKDLWPLIDYGVTILLNATTKVDKDMVWTKFKAVPAHIYLYKALVGDPSDKIPGKRGFGPKAWEKLTYGDREHLIYCLERGLDDDLINDQVRMSWRLALPYTDYIWFRQLGTTGDYMQWLADKGIILCL